MSSNDEDLLAVIFKDFEKSNHTSVPLATTRTVGDMQTVTGANVVRTCVEKELDDFRKIRTQPLTNYNSLADVL